MMVCVFPEAFTRKPAWMRTGSALGGIVCGGCHGSASHKGNFKEEFGIDVECYVLEDAEKTAVISQTGMACAMGLSSRGNALPRFLNSKVMSEILGAELRENNLLIQNPIKFQWGIGGAETPSTTVYCSVRCLPLSI
jgi:hypothetical protein